MSRPIRIGLRVVGGLLLVVVLAVAGLLLFFPEERAVEMAVARIEAATGREVSVGESNIGFLPSLSVRLRDIQFGESATPGAPTVSVDEARLGVKILPLLSRRVEVTEIILVRPLVEVVLADPNEIPETPPPASDPAEADAPGVAIDVQRFEVQDAAVRVRQADGRPLLELDGLSESLTATASREGEILLQGVTTLESVALHLPAGRLGDGLHARLEKTIRFSIPDDRLTLTETELLVAGVPLSLTGSIDGVQSQELVANLTLDGGPGQIDEILGLIPAGLFPQMEGIESGGQLAVSGRVQGPMTDPAGPDFEVSVSLTDGHLTYPGLGRSIEGVAMALQATPDSIEVTEFTAHAGESRLQAHATVAGYKVRPSVRMALDATLALGEFGTFYPLPEGVTVDGRLDARLLAEGPADDPEALRFTGTVSADGVGATAPALTVPLESVTGEVSFDRDTITLESLHGTLGRSDFTASGTVSNYLALAPDSLTTPQGDRPPVIPFAVSGRAHATLDVRGANLDVDQLLPREAEGTASATAPTGDEKRLDPLPPIDATVTLSVDRILVNGIEARAARGALNLRDDVVTLDGVGAKAFGGDVGVGGTIDLTDVSRADFDVTVSAERCQVAELFRATPKLQRFSTFAEYLTGTISTTATMVGALDDTLGLEVPSLVGEGDVRVTDAVLSGHPLQASLATFLKSDEVRSLGIDKILQPFRIENGRLSFNQLALEGSGFEALGDGWSDVTGAYAMNLELLLPQAWAAGVRETLPGDLAGLLFAPGKEQVLVPIRVSGQGAGSPSISLDTDQLTEEARAQAMAKLEAEKAKLEQEAKDRALEAAKDLIGVEGAKTDTASVETALRDEAKEKLDDALKSIFDRGKKKK